MARAAARPAPTTEQASTRTVLVALLTNVAVALAKFVVAAITGSSALLAEAFHSLADSGNEVLLLFAQVRGGRPPDAAHPLGHGREAYFWSLIAAIAVFVGGAVFSLRQGIAELLHPTETTSFIAGYVVLGISFLLEATSLRQAVSQLNREAATLGRTFGTHVLLTSDPTTRAVVAEDTAAIAGDAVAIIGLACTQATGSHVPDAVAAIVIALILGYVAERLARRNRDFLVGEQAPTPTKQWIGDLIAAQPGVVAMNDLLVTFVGPRQLWVLCRIDIDDSLRGSEVEMLVTRTEELLKEASPLVLRADIVTVGRVTPPPD